MDKKIITLGFVLASCIGGSLFAQQNPDGKVAVTNMTEPFLFLVRDAYVHELLDLSKKQTQKLQSLNDKADPKIWSSRNKPAKEAAQTTAKLISISRREIAKILDAQQRERLLQIEMWTQGVRSLLREDVVARLQLTKSQVREIQDILTSALAEKTDLQEQLQDGGDAQKLNRQFAEVQVREQEQILQILQRSQQQQWVAMLGPRIDLKRLGRVKFKAPDFSKSGNWVNSPALTLDKLKGKVVALHFYAFA